MSAEPNVACCRLGSGMPAAWGSGDGLRACSSPSARSRSPDEDDVERGERDEADADRPRRRDLAWPTRRRGRRAAMRATPAASWTSPCASQAASHSPPRPAARATSAAAAEEPARGGEHRRPERREQRERVRPLRHEVDDRDARARAAPPGTASQTQLVRAARAWRAGAATVAACAAQRTAYDGTRESVRSSSRPSGWPGASGRFRIPSRVTYFDHESCSASMSSGMNRGDAFTRATTAPGTSPSSTSCSIRANVIVNSYCEKLTFAKFAYVPPTSSAGIWMLSRRSSDPARVGRALRRPWPHTRAWPSTFACARSPLLAGASRLTLARRDGRLPRDARTRRGSSPSTGRRHGLAHRPRHGSREQRRAVVSIVLVLAGLAIFGYAGAVIVEAIAGGVVRARWRNGGGSGRSSSCATTTSSAATAASAGASPRSSGRPASPYVVLDFTRRRSTAARERRRCCFVEGTRREDEDLARAGPRARARAPRRLRLGRRQPLHRRSRPARARPDLTIVARASDAEAERKLRARRRRPRRPAVLDGRARRWRSSC